MMTNDLILKRQISVNCWNIEATFSKEQQRTELMFVLMFLRDNPSATARDLSKESFFDTSSRIVVAERLLNISSLLGLIEAKRDKGKFTYFLTEDGNKALETKQVFVPEDGTWTILASSDPLLPFPILSVESFNEPRAINDVHNNERDFDDLPSWVRDTQGSINHPCLGKQLIRFDTLKAKAEVKDNQKLQIEWNVSQNDLKLTGYVNDKKINQNIEAPTINYKRIWKELLINEDWWEDWDEENQTLAIEFENTVEQERQSMLGDFIFEQPQLEQFGCFEKLEVNQISLQPLTSNDAQLWAEWRFENSFNDYATDENFAIWQQDALKPFSGFEIDLPEREYLALKYWQNNKTNPTLTSWHLIAAEDWNL